MIAKTLYRKAGVFSYSPTQEGEPSGLVRLIPSEGKWLSDGTQTVSAIDIIEGDAGKWAEVDVPPEEQDEIDQMLDELEDTKAALTKLGVTKVTTWTAAADLKMEPIVKKL